MNEELQKKLFDQFPKVFAAKKDSPFYYRGFECGSGWYPLLCRFSAACELIRQDHNDRLITAQVKEKFGQLRIYIEGPIWAQQLARSAESESKGICEVCGQPGVTIVDVDGLYMTRCTDHESSIHNQ